MIDITILAFELLKGIAKKNSDNEEECARYFSILKNFVGYNVGASETIITILENNEKLLLMIHDSDLTSEEVDNKSLSNS